MLDAFNPLPAYVLGRRWDFLAWNTAAEQALFLSQSVPPYALNAIWRMFVNPLSQQLYHPKWEQEAQKVLAVFRAESAQAADEAWFKRLIADVQHVSQEFRAWWPRHEVRGRVDARKEIAHPVVGCLGFELTSLQVPTQPELKLMIYTPLTLAQMMGVRLWAVPPCRKTRARSGPGLSLSHGMSMPRE